MELFTAAGVDLLRQDARGRRPRTSSGRLRVPLFNHSVVQEAIARANLFDVSDPRRALAADYARKINDPKFLKEKEVAVRPLLIHDLMIGVLGYKAYDPGGYSLAQEYAIRGGSADVAIGRFVPGEGIDELIAPFELKGPKSADLDRVDPGRGRSPVQQAWDYAMDAPGSRWVMVSNCLEIRLYAFGRGRDAYERFDLTRVDATVYRLFDLTPAEIVLLEASLAGQY